MPASARVRLAIALVGAGSVASFTPGLQPPRIAAHRGFAAPLCYAGMATEKAELKEGEEPSFVQTEMRGTAMALHSKDQAREGKQKAQTPVSKWQPGRADYLQFLVDSRCVYACLEEVVGSSDYLADFRDSGLERSAALDADIAWFSEQGVAEPPVAEQGESYVKLLREMAAAEQWQALVCHFYNHYFAHTAGGRMIGKRMSDMLLDGKKLQFYQWEGDVDKDLLPALRGKIDAMAAGWSREEKDACLGATGESFKYGGALLQHISRPPAA